MKFKIGQMACLLSDIYEEGEDLPPGYLAYRGDIVEVVSCRKGEAWDYGVHHMGRRGSFGVKETEISVKGIHNDPISH